MPQEQPIGDSKGTENTAMSGVYICSQMKTVVHPFVLVDRGQLDGEQLAGVHGHNPEIRKPVAVTGGGTVRMVTK